MSAKAKAILNLILNVLASASGAALTAISTADGPNAFKRPYVWLGMVVAVVPVLRATVNESPSGAAEIDRANGK